MPVGLLPLELARGQGRRVREVREETDAQGRRFVGARRAKAAAQDREQTRDDGKTDEGSHGQKGFHCSSR